LSGTALEAKLEGVQGPHWICRSNCDWYRAWISFSELVPEVVDCWFHTLDVLYDEKNNTYSNNKGVSMRPIDWGGVKGVDYLDRIFGYPVWFSAYFAPLIAALEGAGYVTGQNLRAAPYDWRLPNHHDDFVPKLKALIEETYYSNGNSAVHLLCHSMGNLRLLDFLDDQDKAWKDKFVTSWIAVSAPWSGSPKAIRTLISGDNYDFKFGSVPIINQIKIRDLARQAGGIISLVPSELYYENTTIVYTDKRKYTVGDFEELFSDIGSNITTSIYEQVRPSKYLVDKAPEVPVHCLFGTNYPTEFMYYYKNGWDKDPEIFYTEDGDGTVPASSLTKCKRFREGQSEPVYIETFNLAEHTNILTDEDIFVYILNVTTNH
jgi:lysophospholipase-3